MSEQPIYVLFLCTHNSARSIIAEATLNHLGSPRFKGYSAGSSPRLNLQPHPLALQVLTNAGVSIEGLHSKSWDTFAGPDAPHMDLVITVCDNAAGEVCPYWPGHPATAHWGYVDPSETQGGDAKMADTFKHTLNLIHRRIQLLISLPQDRLSKLVLEQSAKALSTS